MKLRICTSMIKTYSYSSSKKAWYLSHINDEYVKKAKAAQYRSRAAFKLLQILEKYKFSYQAVLDLGCAPGSWSQVAKQLNPQAQVIGIDLLETKEIEGVEIYKGDARSKGFHKILTQKKIKFDLIISDMAPNFTGDHNETHEELIELNILCMDLCSKLGQNNNSLIMKTTYGSLEKQLFLIAKTLFKNVHREKPASSRSQSVEFFYICEKFKEEYLNRQIFKKLGSVDLRSVKNKKDLQSILE